MINIKFESCCEECPHIDVIINTAKIIANDTGWETCQHITTEITCKNMEICKRLINSVENKGD